MAGYIAVVEGSVGTEGALNSAEVGRMENGVQEVRREILCHMGSLCLNVGGVRLDTVLERAGSRLYDGFGHMDCWVVGWSDARDEVREDNGHYSHSLEEVLVPS
jgi:hypothetical protein